MIEFMIFLKKIISKLKVLMIYSFTLYAFEIIAFEEKLLLLLYRESLYYRQMK